MDTLSAVTFLKQGSSTSALLDQMILCCGTLQDATKHSTEIPLRCQQQIVVTVKNVSRHCQMPLEGKIIPIENHCSTVICSPLVL